MPVRGGDGLLEGVAGARVDVAGLQGHQDRSGPSVGQGLLERVGPHPSPVVDGHRLGGTEAEVVQRDVDGVVPLFADEHPDTRAAGQPLPRDVPPRPAEHRVAPGREPGEVGHGGAGREADGALRGEAQQV
ncbi:hypothetical protein BJF80_09520 [Serinicoccus sp. CUA-874]|nr:hypothetical protein BJF80_09520 [Serinicoccus sp. CUA-874]